LGYILFLKHKGKLRILRLIKREFLLIMLTNDTLNHKPKTGFDGPELLFHFPDFQIGVAEYDEGPTGCTVFYFPKGVTTAIDIRGGTPGTMGNHPWNHAICFAGGSYYGLEAAAGVAAELFAMGGHARGFMDIARVTGAVIYDFLDRENAIYPDKGLGRTAIQSARSGWFPLGLRGAGRSATVGKGADPGWGEPSGQGAAFCEVGPTKIAAFTVVSAMGAIVDRGGKVVKGHLDRKTGNRTHLAAKIGGREGVSGIDDRPSGNTTLSLVVTNQKFRATVLNQIARQIHASMARAIQPFHTTFDGDVLYAVTTGEVSNKNLNPMAFGTVASETVWDAVLSIV